MFRCVLVFFFIYFTVNWSPLFLQWGQMTLEIILCCLTVNYWFLLLLIQPSEATAADPAVPSSVFCFISNVLQLSLISNAHAEALWGFWPHSSVVRRKLIKTQMLTVSPANNCKQQMETWGPWLTVKPCCGFASALTYIRIWLCGNGVCAHVLLENWVRTNPAPLNVWIMHRLGSDEAQRLAPRRCQSTVGCLRLRRRKTGFVSDSHDVLAHPADRRSTLVGSPALACILSCSLPASWWWN